MHYKGKIERSFRTLKDGYINCTDWNSFKSLEHLNSEFSIYLNLDYQNKIHSSISDTPKNSYLKDSDLIKYKSEEELETNFLHRVTRKVRLDATITVDKKFFETPQKYIKLRIDIRYDPNNLNELYIFNKKNELIDTIYPLRKIDNSKIKRNSLDYSQLCEHKQLTGEEK